MANITTARLLTGKRDASVSPEISHPSLISQWWIQISFDPSRPLVLSALISVYICYTIPLVTYLLFLLVLMLE